MLIVARNETNVRIRDELRKLARPPHNLTISRTYHINSSYSCMTEQLKRIVEASCDQTRIYVLLATTLVSIDLIKHLHRIRPVLFRQYAVVSLDYDIVYSSIDEQNYFNSLIDRTNETGKFSIYNALMLITPSPATNASFDDFCDQIAERTTEKRHSLEGKESPQYNVFAALAYDSVRILADALGAALANNETSTDGHQLTAYLLNRIYRSVLGFDVRLDSNGNAEGHYVVLTPSRNVSRVNKSRWRNQPFFMNFEQVGIFLANENSDLPSLHFLQSATEWTINKLQLKDEPNCGFQNEKCRQRLGLLLIALVILLFILLTIGLCLLVRFVVRHAELEATHWKIDFNEVPVLAIDKNQDCHDVVKAIKRFKSDEKNLFGPGKKRSQKSLDGNNGIGFYKGNTVFIKKLRKQITEETSPFCNELVQVNFLVEVSGEFED